MKRSALAPWGKALLGALALSALAACSPSDPQTAEVQPAPVAAPVTDQHAAEMAAPRSEAEMAQVTNETCPVMVGNKVNPEVFVEHEGQKVYFCCSACPEKFKKDPAKYMAALKTDQKTEADPHAGHDHG